jgi:glutamate synthase domain-containing protein 1
MNGGIDMYFTKLMNGPRTIQRNRRNVLRVWDQNWRFAYQFCELLNELEDGPKLLLNQEDRNWLKAMDRAFDRKAQHA